MTSNSFRSARRAPWVIALLLAATFGCGGSDDATPSTAAEPHGPHGGHTATMSEGAGFELEFTLDERRRRLVIYALEPSGGGSHPLAEEGLDGRFEADGQTIEVRFTADPRADDPPGSASRFVFPLDKLPQQLAASDRFVLKLSYTAGGRPITASISHNNDHGHEYRHD